MASKQSLSSKARAAAQPVTNWIAKIDVERKGDIYYAGPFRSKQDADKYVEEYHGELDRTEVIPLKSGLQAAAAARNSNKVNRHLLNALVALAEAPWPRAGECDDDDEWIEPGTITQPEPSEYTLMKTDQDGGEVGYETYDSLSELLKEWPNASQVSEFWYEDLVGGEPDQADVTVAVKLDGHGKNFSKKDIEDMKKDLQELGFKKADIAAMDDQDIIGTWQAETGYVESDD